MPTVGELNEKHGALLAKVRELRDAHKDKEMPAEKAAEVDRLLDEADEVKAQLESLVAEAERRKRLDEHTQYATESKGALPGMGFERSVESKAIPGVGAKGGFVGFQDGERWTPLWRSGPP